MTPGGNALTHRSWDLVWDLYRAGASRPCLRPYSVPFRSHPHAQMHLESLTLDQFSCRARSKHCRKIFSRILTDSVDNRPESGYMRKIGNRKIYASPKRDAIPNVATLIGHVTGRPRAGPLPSSASQYTASLLSPLEEFSVYIVSRGSQS